ncbi:MAG: acetolactate synthase small subunit [Muribaculaceae bacterium]|nr:acetolactate synthase small subunit [Muribaculaceae bacterium]
MNEIKPYTLSVFSENTVGILNLISIVYTRRSINIESVSASTTAIPGIFKTTVLSYSDRETMEKVLVQIEKAIFVVKAYLYTDDQIVHQEVALYKVPTEKLMDEENLEKIIRHHNARILEITSSFTIIEKTGHTDETEALFNELKKYGLLQFVRSGRVCVTKDTIEHVSVYLAQRDREKEELNKLKD